VPAIRALLERQLHLHKSSDEHLFGITVGMIGRVSFLDIFIRYGTAKRDVLHALKISAMKYNLRRNSCKELKVYYAI